MNINASIGHREKKKFNPKSTPYLAKMLKNTVGCSFMRASISQVKTQNKDIFFIQAANL